MSSSRWTRLKNTFNHCTQSSFDWLDQKAKTTTGKYFISGSTGAGVAFAIYGIGQLIFPSVLPVKIILGIVGATSFLIVSKAKYTQLLRNEEMERNKLQIEHLEIRVDQMVDHMIENQLLNNQMLYTKFQNLHAKEEKVNEIANDPGIKKSASVPKKQRSKTKLLDKTAQVELTNTGYSTFSYQNSNSEPLEEKPKHNYYLRR